MEDQIVNDKINKLMQCKDRGFLSEEVYQKQLNRLLFPNEVLEVSAATESASTVSSASMEDQILDDKVNKLTQLKDRGVLSEHLFEEQLNRLLFPEDLEVSAATESASAVSPGGLKRSLLNALEAIEEEGGFKPKKMVKLRASDFVSSGRKPFAGFGLSGHCPLFDPTDVEEDTRTSKPSIIFGKTNEELYALVGGDLVEVAVQALEKSLTIYNDLSSVSETTVRESEVGKDLTVQRHHLDVIACDMFEECRLLISRKSLSKFNCDEGLVKSSSEPDGCFLDSQGFARGIFEAKGGEYAPSEGLRQGAAEAINVALMQLKLGVNVNDIVVPVVASNGYLIQFGAVIMLQPSSPTFVVLTHVLDLTNEAALTEAARMLCCIKIWVATKLNLARSPPITRNLEIELCSIKYHRKKLENFYTSTGSMQSSLCNFFKVMAHLHKDEVCKKYVVFPICVLECYDSLEESAIVFPKLDTSYKIGLPDTPELRASFLDQLKKAITAFHDAGVVHLDLFLSNIMWRQVGPNEVQLKIIDWDSAHFMAKGLSLRTIAKLKNTFRRDKVRDKVAKELQFDKGNAEMMMRLYDISLICVFEKYINEPSLRVREKPELDVACQKFQLEYIGE